MSESLASPQSRILAKGIDLVVVVALASLMPGLLGPLLGICYSVFADGIHLGALQGQSLGKKLLGLKVRNVVLQRQASFKDSALRNSSIAFVILFAMIPIWGWLILFFVGIPLVLIETYLLFRVDSRQRLGDVMADTEVIAPHLAR